MLSFLKPASKQSQHPAASEKRDNVQSIPAQDDSAHADQTEVRASSSSIPTIDTAPTVHGLPVEPPLAQTSVQPSYVPLPDSPKPAASLVPASSANAQGSAPSVLTQSTTQSHRPMQNQSQSALPYSPPGPNSTSKDPRRFSFPSFSFLRPGAKQSKARTIPPLHPQATPISKASEKKPKSNRTLSALIVGTDALSEKRAKDSAAIVRSVIVGDHNAPADHRTHKTKAISRSDISHVKSQLLDPKMAAKVITHLRELPAHPNEAASKPNVPIHAVCLSMPDKDVLEHYFARLESIATASISTVSDALTDLHLIDLVTAPNMGFGAPVTSPGLLAGSVPSAETVLQGIEQITPQLLALGYATGKAILPDHKGVVVPTDRISALTYWWGFEICLPSPTIAYLEEVESPGDALLNLLTALSLLNAGVREILPFIRYIAQFAQSEWGMIKRADKGKGVVCTATWLLPIALVPRAWDFTDPPPHTEVGAAAQSTPTSPSVNRFSATLTMPKPSTEFPNGAPRASSVYSAETRDEEEPRPIISSEPPVLPEVVVSSPGSIDSAPPESVKSLSVRGKVRHSGEAIAR